MPEKSVKKLKKRFGGKGKVATFAARFGEEAAEVAGSWKARDHRVRGRKAIERRKFVDIMERSKQVVQEINFKENINFWKSVRTDW